MLSLRSNHTGSQELSLYNIFQLFAQKVVTYCIVYFWDTHNAVSDLTYLKAVTVLRQTVSLLQPQTKVLQVVNDLHFAQ